MDTCKLCLFHKLKVADTNVLDFEYMTAGSYTFLQCARCGLLNITPVPDDVKLAEAYPSTYHAYHPHANALAKYMKKKYWKRKASRYAKFAHKEAYILDIGCSSRDLMIAFKEQGFKNVRGLDFNKEVIEKARSRGLEVSHGNIEMYSAHEGNFQMIVMDNFIEHVYNPIEIFKKCHDLLSPGGVVVGETPNVDSWDYRLFRRYWGGYHTPRHLNLFNVYNLSVLAEKTGFRVKRINNIMQPAHWVISIQNLFHDILKIKNGRSFCFTPLLVFFIPIN